MTLEEYIDKTTYFGLRLLIEIHQYEIDFGYLHLPQALQSDHIGYHRSMVATYQEQLRQVIENEEPEGTRLPNRN